MSEDKRSRKSKQSIIDAFIELSNEKDISTITVTEICKKADVNRSTFYAHYKDYSTFVSSVESELIHHVISLVEEYHYDMDGRQFIADYYDFFAKHMGRLSLILKNEQTIKTIINSIEARAFPAWLEDSNISVEQADLLMTFTIYGLFYMTKKWLDSDCHLPEKEFKDILENVAKYGLYNYIYTK